jgi:hypothetical protein
VTDDQSSEIFSERLEALAAEIIRGQEPNAGRFCGHCYNPLAVDATTCSHCARSLAETESVDRIPREVLLMINTKHSREARVVRTIAYGGLLLATIAASAALLFISGVWGIIAFVAVLVAGYFLSAIIANSLGDAWGYRSGQKGLASSWQEFLARRETEGKVPTAEPSS